MCFTLRRAVENYLLVCNHFHIYVLIITSAWVDEILDTDP